MDIKYNQYINFDFEHCQDWINYYSNIFPTPPPHKYDYYKRKYYKLKIDPDFDVNYQPTNTSLNTTYNYQYKLILYTDFLFISLMLIQFFFFSDYIIYSFMIYFCYKCLYKMGFTNINSQYISKIITFENFHCFILSFILFNLSQVLFVFLLPNIFLIILQFCLSLQKVYLNQNKILLYMKNNVTNIMIIKGIYEIYLLLYIIFSLITGKCKFLLLVIYYHFIKFKYFSSKITKKIFNTIGNNIDRLLS